MKTTVLCTWCFFYYYYFCVFPFIVFQSRLPLYDRALQVKSSHLHITQNIKMISWILFLTPNYILIYILIYQNERKFKLQQSDNQGGGFSKNIRKLDTTLICFLSRELHFQSKVSESVLSCGFTAQASHCLQMWIPQLCFPCYTWLECCIAFSD